MEPDPKVYEWDALIVGDGDGGGAFVRFPWPLKEEFGKANLVPVKVDFEGEAYQGSLANMGTGPLLVVLKGIRERLGKQPGDTVHVRLWHDTAPRIVVVPDDLTQVLAEHPKARATWEGLSNSHRREYVRWIDDAKKAETRAVRLAKTVALLAEGKSRQ